MTNSQILDAINQNIKRNENKEITGVILNSVLRMLLDFVNQGFITFSDIIQLLADSKAVNVVGSINTTTETTSLPNGVYHAQISGTYPNAGNIVVKEGYYTLLRKDGGVWKLESEVEMPMQDLTPIENRMTALEHEWENYVVDVDQEFDENSENSIANKTVTKVIGVDKFTDESIYSYKNVKILHSEMNSTETKVFNNNNQQVDSTLIKRVDYNVLANSIIAINTYGNSTTQLNIASFVIRKKSDLSVLTNFTYNNEVNIFERYFFNFDVIVSIQYDTTATNLNERYITLAGYDKELIYSKKIVDIPDLIKSNFFELKTVNSDFIELDKNKIPSKKGVISFNMNTVGNPLAWINTFNSAVFKVSFGDIYKISSIFGYNDGIAIADNNGIFIGSLAVGDNTSIVSAEVKITENVGFLIVSYRSLETLKISKSTATYQEVEKQFGDSTSISSDEFVRVSRPKFGRIDFVGQMPTDASDTRLPTDLTFKIYDESKKQLVAGNCQLSIQGHGSAVYPKKGYTFDIFNENNKSLDIKFGDMVATDSFHLKAYATDRTHTRDVGSGRIWRDMINTLHYPFCKVNNNPFTLSTTKDKNELYTADAVYHTEGFPCEVYLNGSFYGLYTLRHKKKRENYALNNKNLNHIFLDSSTYTAYLKEVFDHTDWDVKSPKMSGYKEAGVIPNADVLAKCQRLFEFTSQLNTRYAEHADYINLSHWIDWIILSELISNLDTNGNNYNLITWNGNVWSIIPYDMDLTLGLNAWSNNTIETNRPSMDVSYDIWRTFKTRFASEIKARYTELRNSKFISTGNFSKYYTEISSNIPRSVYQADREKWGLIWTNDEPSVEQIILFLDNKIKYLDTQWKL